VVVVVRRALEPRDFRQKVLVDSGVEDAAAVKTDLALLTHRSSVAPAIAASVVKLKASADSALRGCNWLTILWKPAWIFASRSDLQLWK
jgi:hypothetical protein